MTMKLLVVQFVLILGLIGVVATLGDESMLAGSAMIGALIPWCFYIVIEAREVWRDINR